mmetsp:Transcript_30752/g.73811  ORF Transcript_30752/g.73811 Transcript_30752/m.73811 type:complete len:492 (-) Transcript_30752:641-2116(-)
MATEEDFERLFDASILASLEGALNDISLEIQSSSTDLKYTTEGDVLSVNSDFSSIQNDDTYTNDTNATGFSSDEEEDPETGEQELFAMMDDLVAELETEMEFFTDESKGGEKLSNAMKQEENKEEKHSNLDPESHSHSQTPSTDEISGKDCTVDATQGRNNNQRAKSLLKVFSELAQPEERNKKAHWGGDTGEGNQNSAIEGTVKGNDTTQNSIQALSNATSSAATASENAEENETEDSHCVPFVPTQADFKHFVGVLAGYSKRKRREHAPNNTNSNVAYSEGSSCLKLENLANKSSTLGAASNKSNVLSNPREEAGLPARELPHPHDEELLRSQDQREKTSRAIANFTLKKRREYMTRKSRSRNTEAVASLDTTSAIVTGVRSDPDDLAGDQNEATKKTISEPVRRTSSRKKKKRPRQRTNKHRKGRPKRLAGGLQDPQHIGHSPIAASQCYSSNNDYDNHTREEVIRELAKTELWRWLVTHVQEGTNKS